MNITKAFWFLKTQMMRCLYGSLGSHSYMGRVAFIQRKKNFYIGSNVRIYPGLRAEMTCETASIKIGDNVSIGQNFHVVSYKGELTIGNDTTISGNVFISNVDHSYSEIGKHILDQEMIYKETIIGENCFVGYGAVIMPGTKLGKQCIVGANSIVKGEFPNYCVIAGNPARIIKKYNSESNEWIKTGVHND